jgi:hypothetical protein
MMGHGGDVLVSFVLAAEQEQADLTGSFAVIDLGDGSMQQCRPGSGYTDS